MKLTNFSEGQNFFQFFFLFPAVNSFFFRVFWEVRTKPFRKLRICQN